jgi:hypothetical protein
LNLAGLPCVAPNLSVGGGGRGTRACPLMPSVVGRRVSIHTHAPTPVKPRPPWGTCPGGRHRPPCEPPHARGAWACRHPHRRQCREVRPMTPSRGHHHLPAGSQWAPCPATACWCLRARSRQPHSSARQSGRPRPGPPPPSIRSPHCRSAGRTGWLWRCCKSCGAAGLPHGKRGGGRGGGVVAERSVAVSAGKHRTQQRRLEEATRCLAASAWHAEGPVINALNHGWSPSCNTKRGADTHTGARHAIDRTVAQPQHRAWRRH